MAVTGKHSLRLGFEDGLSREIDFAEMLEGEVFGPLRDPALFAQVRIDDEVQTIVWPNGADFDPATLHDWPEHAPAFAAAARQWSSDPAGG